MKILTVFLFTSALIFSQGEHIYDNSFGFGANYLYSGVDNVTGSGVALGLSVLGKFDVSFSHVTSQYETGYSGENFKSSSNTVMAGYNAKFKEKGNLKIMFGYMTISTSVPYSPDISADGIAFGIMFNYKVLDINKFVLMPGLGIVYGFLSSSYDNSSTSSTFDLRTLGAEINFVFTPVREFKLVFAPSVSVDLNGKENTATTGFEAGVLINLTSK
ncbi:MAG: hypothetical protein IPM56_11205 [Ignavibacteriales bacterium]|nr:MAG: hypothetical protein IPM56_11205 [Ignavibacteriales bacterium]